MTSSSTHSAAGPTGPVVAIPADVEMQDRILGPFTARQLGVLAATAAALYVLWWALRAVLPALPAVAFVAGCVPVGAVVVDTPATDSADDHADDRPSDRAGLDDEHPDARRPALRTPIPTARQAREFARLLGLDR